MQINIENPKELEAYLKVIGLIKKKDAILSLHKAGDGNMNLTMRAACTEKSLIVKKANPYVQKYPSIKAPAERSHMEAAFYKLAGKIPAIANYLPELIHSEPDQHIQVIEDLGEGNDFTIFYQITEHLPEGDIIELVQFLKALHAKKDWKEHLENREMRKLNHFHIFVFPFDSKNGFDLNSVQPGLANLAEASIFAKEGLKDKAAELGELYLNAKGPSLLHGDFYPGSWLNTDSGLRIIDPEFCFMGPGEFDLGIMAAHFRFCGVPFSAIEKHFRAYGNYNQELMRRFLAVEILRRLFGVAQLPLDMNISSKKQLALEAIETL